MYTAEGDKKEQRPNPPGKGRRFWRAGEGFSPLQLVLLGALTAGVFLLCVCVGSVTQPPGEVLRSLLGAFGNYAAAAAANPIVVSVRLPRVLSAALVGAALSLCGAAMQGLLRNPLADGSTMGVSAGASLGAVLAIAFGWQIPFWPGGGTVLSAMAFAGLSLALILGLAYRLDYSLATNTIILIGVVFTMFASSVNSLVITFAGDAVKTIVFWSLGSLTGIAWRDVVVLVVVLAAGSAVLLRYGRELNAFSIGEDNARHVGIDVRRVKLVVLIAVAAMIGVAVSVSGTIGFVGLIIPHITRLITGPNHRRLLPASLFLGASFLMLADLVARTLLRPRELPIGVVTSMIGAVMFVVIFYRSRRAG